MKIFKRKAGDQRSPVAWPLFLLSLPAFVSIWGGWVGMGRLTGFGPINLLPGIADVIVDTAITLPIGLETYAAYSMYAWLAAAHLSTSTRRFAKWSALGSLVLGMAGQAAYHVMESTGVEAAPVEIVIAVSAIPVIVLGLGTGLAHAMRKDWHAYQATLQVARADAGTDVPEVPDVAPVERHVPEVPDVERHVPEPAPAPVERHVPEVPAMAPAPVAENVPAPAPRGKPKPRPVNAGARDLSTNERYRVGLEAYHRAVVVTGRKLSQRDLAAAMGMKNRDLAKKVQKDYDEAAGNGTLEDLLTQHGITTDEEKISDEVRDASHQAA
jgi:outer membrane biosynthesis protein TonB